MAKDGNYSKNKHLSLILRISIAFLACWIIYQNINPAEVAHKFTSVHIWVLILLAAAVFSGGLCLIGLRWWVFMRAQDIRISPFWAVKLTFLGQFFTNFLPSAVGGDVIRAWYVSRHTHKRLQAALGVAVDRLMGLAATFILAITSYLLFMRGQGLFTLNRTGPGPIGTYFDKHPVSASKVLMVLMILTGMFFVFWDLFELKKFFEKIYRHFTHLLGQLKEVLLVYYHHPLVLVFGLVITIFLQSLVILSLWLVGRDLGMETAFRFYLVFFPIIWVVGAVPVSIAGIGILEGGIVLLFVQFTGADREAAIALALCQRLTWIIGSLPGMAVHLIGAGRNKEGQS